MKLTWLTKFAKFALVAALSGAAIFVCAGFFLGSFTRDVMPGALASTPHHAPGASQSRAAARLHSALGKHRAGGSQSFEELISQGKKQFADRQFKEAAATFTECFRHNPQDIGVSYYQGLAAFYAEDYALSRLALARVIALSQPNNPFSANALNVFNNYSSSMGGAKPYYALDNSYGHFVRWSRSDFPLKVCITPGLALPYHVNELMADYHKVCPYLCDPSFYRGLQRSKGFKSEYFQAAQSGAQAWEPARQSGFVEYQFVDDPTVADIVVFFTAEDMGANVAGRTFTHVDQDETGKVFIVVRCAAEEETVDKREFFFFNLKQCVAHELGHAFGILGHSHNPKDVMRDNPETIQIDRYGHIAYSPVITASDILTLEAIYSVPPEFCLTGYHRRKGGKK